MTVVMMLLALFGCERAYHEPDSRDWRCWMHAFGHDAQGEWVSVRTSWDSTADQYREVERNMTFSPDMIAVCHPMLVSPTVSK